MENKPENITTPLVTAFSSTAVPETVVEIKDPRLERNVIFKPFGSDNLYPQALASLYRKSIALRGIINSKVIYCSAGGFQLEEESGEATDFVNSPNNTGDSLTDVFEKYLTDRFMSGNTYLEIVTNPERTMFQAFNVQTTKARRHKNEKDIIIHPDWARYKKNDGLSTIIPLFPNFKMVDGFMRSIIHAKDYEPDFDWYGIPSYIAAMDAAAIGYKTNKWNVSRLDNAFQTSGVLVVDGNMSDDEAKELKKDFQKEMTGEGNQGKVMLIIKKLGGEGTEFTSINDNAEGDWVQLHNQSNDDLILANNWKKSLAGITEQSGFDVDRIINDYQVVKSTFLIKEQNKFIKLIQKAALEVKNLDLEGLTVKNLPPVSLITKLTADKFTFKWEARREAGLEFDSEDPVQIGYIEESAPKTTTERTVEGFSKTLSAIKQKLGI